MERRSRAYRPIEEVEPRYGLSVDRGAIGAPYDSGALRPPAETPNEDVSDMAENAWADLPPEPAYVGRPRKDETLSAFQLYRREIYRIPLLEPEQERQLAQRKDSGDTEALRQLIEPHLRLVVDMAKKFAYSGRDIEELVQAGNFGLMRAAERFDYRRGVRLVGMRNTTLRPVF